MIGIELRCPLAQGTTTLPIAESDLPIGDVVANTVFRGQFNNYVPIETHLLPSKSL
jgi:hypothetical protein